MVTETIKSGYKQTELGVIPEEWDVTNLGDIAYITKLAGFEYSNYFNSYKDGGNIIVIRGTNITHNKLDLSDVRNIPQSTSDKLPRSKLLKNDLVFAYVGTIGPVYLIEEDNKYHLGPNTCKIAVEGTVSPKFMFSYFNSHLIKTEIDKQTSVGAQPSLSMTKIRNFKIILPKTKEEQSAIAQVLSETDELIDLLNKQITKKKNLKKGAMQELLTGQRRLPEFSGEWEEKYISEIGETRRGAGSQYLNYLSNNGIRLIRINDFFENNPVYIEQTGDIMRFLIERNDILFAGTGETAGSSFIPPNEWLGLPHSYNVPRIRINQNINKQYVFYSLNSDYILKQQNRLFVGAAQHFLDITAISNLKIFIPKDPKEQSAITQVLSDMDAEIESLEQKRDKYQKIKKGMMQQLLIGRIRLT